MAIWLDRVQLTPYDCGVALRIMSRSRDVVTVDRSWLDGTMSSGLRFWGAFTSEGYFIRPAFPVPRGVEGGAASAGIVLAPGAAEELTFTWPMARARAHGLFLPVDKYGDRGRSSMKRLPAGAYAVDFAGELRIARGAGAEFREELVLSSNKAWLRVEAGAASEPSDGIERVPGRSTGETD